MDKAYCGVFARRRGCSGGALLYGTEEECLEAAKLLFIKRPARWRFEFTPADPSPLAYDAVALAERIRTFGTYGIIDDPTIRVPYTLGGRLLSNG